MIRPTHPAGERALDELAATRGLVRDPQAEDQAFVMGALLALEAGDMGAPAWARWVAGFRSMGPVERVIMWSSATQGCPPWHGPYPSWDDESCHRDFLAYKAWMRRARAINRHLASLVLDAFDLGDGGRGVG